MSDSTPPQAFDRQTFLLETWPEALESGEYRQGRLMLRDEQGRYCCLGVACKLLTDLGHLEMWEWEGLTLLPVKVALMLGLSRFGSYGEEGIAGPCLVNDNDRYKRPFPVIAATIRRVTAEDDWLALS